MKTLLVNIKVFFGAICLLTLSQCSSSSQPNEAAISEQQTVYDINLLADEGDYYPQVKSYTNGKLKVRSNKLFSFLSDDLILHEEYTIFSALSSNPMSVIDKGIWVSGIVKTSGVFEITTLVAKKIGIKDEEIREYIAKFKWNPALKNLVPVDCKIEIFASEKISR